ncbi:MAG: ATP-binding protein [Acidobacteriota bacterium]
MHATEAKRGASAGADGVSALRPRLHSRVVSIAALALGLLNLVIGVGHLFFLDGPGRVALASLALSIGVVLVLSSLALRLRPVGSELGSHLAGLLSLLALVQAAVLMFYRGTPLESTTLMTLIVGVGCVLVDVRWLSFILAASWATWLAVAQRARWEGEWVHFGFAMLSVTAISLVVFRVRVLSARRIDQLRRLAEERAAALEVEVRDRTDELERANEKLRQQVDSRIEVDEMNRRLRQSLDRAGEGLVLLDRYGRILYGNSALFEMMDRRPEEVDVISDLSEGFGDDRLLQEIAEGFEQGMTWKGRYATTHRSGETFHRDATVTPVLDADGRLKNVIGVIRDVSKEVELEDRLLQGQKLDSIGRLAGGVAHDFNNLLTVILGYSQALISDLDEDTLGHRDAMGIEQAALSAAQLTRQLLAFGRRQVMAPKVVDLNGEIQSTSKMLRRLIGEHIELRCELEEGLWPVRVDPGQMEQVLTNLVANARDAMPSGGVLTVRTTNATEAVEEGAPRRVVRLTVSDEGEGMSAEIRDKLFEPFFTTKGVGEGTGLGLAQVYGIVQQSAGEVDVESSVGHGTTVVVRLPAVDREESPARRSNDAEESAQDPSATVLVVEDEEEVRRLICRTLRSRGYEVLEANDGVDGLEIARRRDFDIDLVLADVVMPRLGGPGMVRAFEEHCDAPVIFMSGYAHERRALDPRSSSSPLLEKPFESSELLAAVRRALGGERLAQASGGVSLH